MALVLSIHAIRKLGFDWPKYAIIGDYAVTSEGGIDLLTTLEKLRSSRAYYKRQLVQAFNFKQQTGADYSDFSDRFDGDVRLDRDLGAAVAHVEGIVKAAGGSL